MTPVFCCGFSCGALQAFSASSTPHWLNQGGTAVEISAATVRTGAHALRIHPAAAVAQAMRHTLPSSPLTIARVYVYFATLPDVDAFICHNSSSTLDGDSYGIVFRAADATLYCRTNAGVLGATGIVVTTGQWYLVELKVNGSVSPTTVDGRVNGVALGQATRAVTDTFTAFTLGSDPLGNWTGDVFFDDVLVSQTAADYPLGGGTVDAFIPTADGTHNVAGANQFERGNTGVDITNATTDAYLLVDDVPLPLSVAAADTIAVIAPANATDYVEVVFGPAAGVSTPTTAPRMVDAVCAFHQGGVIGDAQLTLALNDNGTVADIVNINRTGVTTIQLGYLGFPTPPTGGPWTVGAGAGNFNALRARILSADAAPDQLVDGLLLEGEWAEVAPTPTALDWFPQTMEPGPSLPRIVAY